MKRCAAMLLFAWSLADVGHAAYFAGNAFVFQPPTTQMGTIASSNLTVNNGPLSFTVSGVVKVQVPPGPVSGTLVEYLVERPLDPTYGTSNMITTTTINGFSIPPSGGTYGDTLGVAYSYLTNYPTVSESNIPLTLTAGVGTWNQITVQSSVFSYTSQSGVHYLRQRFELDGVQLSGAGGLWTIDLPLTTEVMKVPEPDALAGVMVCLGIFALRRRRTRPSTPGASRD